MPVPPAAPRFPVHQRAIHRDGIVWRITPEGEATRVVDGGIGDPNFILVLPDRSFLISDDATDEIFRADLDGSVEIFSRAISHPNGMALADDGETLFVAQSFQQIRPYVLDDRLWAMPLSDGLPAGEPEIVAQLGEQALNDGLALDADGRVYIALNARHRTQRPGRGLATRSGERRDHSRGGRTAGCR